ncbi:hypothetical protein F66182_3372 [Fusarium sp. NRRL 66182]|nr:hypothetical protein F66182_3372 [Fusarium sp. NRRL 66182]
MSGKFYAVAIGHKTGITKSYDECRLWHERFPGSKHKSFATHDKAREWLKTYGITPWESQPCIAGPSVPPSSQSGPSATPSSQSEASALPSSQSGPPSSPLSSSQSVDVQLSRPQKRARLSMDTAESPSLGNGRASTVFTDNIEATTWLLTLFRDFSAVRVTPVGPPRRQ